MKPKLSNETLTDIGVHGISHHEFGGHDLVIEMAKEILMLRERWEKLKDYVKTEQRAVNLSIKKPSKSTDQIDSRTLSVFNSGKYEWKSLSPHLIKSALAELQEWRELNDEG